MHQTDTLVLGAGMSGVSAARHLHRAGQQVLLVDKGGGYGGRMATRRMATPAGGEISVDFGAQFFTSRTSEFSLLVQEMMKEEKVREWAKGFPAGSETETRDGHPRYCGMRGMTDVPKFLAEGIPLHRKTKITRLTPGNDHWEAIAENGERFSARQIILTAPVPQSLELLTDSGILLHGKDKQELGKLRYHPCLAVLAVLAGPSALPAPGALRINDGPIAWMADNQQKGLPGRPSAVTIHGSQDFSATYFEGDREQAGSLLVQAALEWLGSDVLSYQVHGWRFSEPIAQYPERSYRIQSNLPLVLAGDAFGEPRVEGAFLSGVHAARSLCASKT